MGPMVRDVLSRLCAMMGAVLGFETWAKVETRTSRGFD